SVAAGGTLGQMIPPSGALIVFGIIAQESIGELFTAAIVPGVTQALLYMLVVALLVRWKPELAPSSPKSSWPERWTALGCIGDMMARIAIVIGGIVFGLFTPSEAASIGAVGALAICIWRKR